MASVFYSRNLGYTNVTRLVAQFAMRCPDRDLFSRSHLERDTHFSEIARGAH